MGINNNQNYFLEIVKEKNITKAADALYISQPSLSKYLKRLESELGVSLLDRHHQPLMLTDCGKLYLDYIDSCRHLESSFLQKISEYRSGYSGTITVGLAYYRATFLLPFVLPGFWSKYPKIMVNIREGAYQVSAGLIESGGVDFGLMNIVPEAIPQLDYDVLFNESIIYATHRDSDVARHFGLVVGTEIKNLPSLTFQDIKDAPLIMNKPGQSIYIRVKALFTRYKHPINRIFTAENLDLSLRLVNSGIGSVFVPSTGIVSLPTPFSNVVYAKIDEPELKWAFGAIYKRNKPLSHLSRCFINYVKDSYQDIV